MRGRFLAYVPSALCGLIVFFAGKLAVVPDGVPAQANCKANGCDAFWDVYSPRHFTLTGGASHPTTGHGKCTCDGTECKKVTDCTITHVFTVDAGANWICDGTTSMGHTESFTVTVNECGKDDKAEFTIQNTSACNQQPPIETVSLRIYCKLCEAHNGLGCP